MLEGFAEFLNPSFQKLSLVNFYKTLFGARQDALSATDKDQGI
jgi:hypothetical protein